MKISALIEQLQRELAYHGDIEVVTELPESVTGERFTRKLSTVESLTFISHWKLNTDRSSFKSIPVPAIMIDWRC